MKKKYRLKNALKAYLKWPLLLSILLIGVNVFVYFRDIYAGYVFSCVLTAYIAGLVIFFYVKRGRIMEELVRFAAEYGQVQRKLLRELEVAYAVLDMDGHILWANGKFLEITGISDNKRRVITGVLPDITKNSLPHTEEDAIISLKLEDQSFRVEMRRITLSSFADDGCWNDSDASMTDESNAMVALYMYDETDIVQLKQENWDQRLILGLLYIDNYEEALESIDEVRRSLLTALVDRKINKYFQNIDAIIKKIEKDKYFFVFQNKYLEQLKASRFPILDEVRAVNIGNEMAVTISMGLGVNSESFTRGYEAARAAIDLALGRGGDQVVIKDRENIVYYGGKSGSVEKSTRVKARVKAHALKEFVESKDRVVIMGHSIADVDSFGAAIGVYRVAKTLNKKAYIVLNEVTSSVRAVVNRFINNPDYDEDMIVNNMQAMELVDANTLLLIVDVNKPSYTECPELLDRTKTVVILDHHRQTGESVENAVLSYIEPYASSACEMVAEILQYIGDGLKLRPAEADAMYSGIMIDTNNFLTKTGVRTFEAAAYLRRSGADVTRIRKSFRTELPEYMAKASAVAATETFLEHYALTICDAKGLESPTIIGAQVANELLNIINIKASFVFTEFNGKIYVSARSIDELNVQVVMEKLGGGGHMSVAGVQFTDCSLQEAMGRVREVLRNMTTEGEI